MRTLKFNPDEDMKELEKHGFLEGADENGNELYMRDIDFSDYVLITKDKNVYVNENDDWLIRPANPSDVDDLIKANLLIVEDKNEM